MDTTERLTFPSLTYRQALHQRIQAAVDNAGSTPSKYHKDAKLGDGAGYASLTLNEKWHWHSYVYAFERTVGGGNPNAVTTPVDPTGAWRNEALISVAMRSYRRKPRPSAIRPADTERDPERRRLFEDQDAERSRLAALISGDGFLSNGDCVPELATYLACCKAQVRQNVEMFERRQRAARSPRRLRDLSEEMAAIREAMGDDLQAREV